MGKDKESSKQKKQVRRHQPLEQQIKQDTASVRAVPRKKLKKQNKDESDEDEQGLIEERFSAKILDLARSSTNDPDDDEEISQPKMKKEKKGMEKDSDSDDEISRAASDEEIIDENYEIEELNAITEEEERALEMFMSNEAPQRMTLADIIMQKIKEQESVSKLQLEDKISSTLDPKVVQVYKGVGDILTRYSTGKVPKAFKILPVLSNWEEILFLTNPDGWSPAAVRVATKIFASNLNARMAQRFYSLVLLPRVMDDIRTNKRLNFHLYLALKKALYKPAAFYKGILLPLCESGRCTLRMATIIGSVLSKVSVPVLHSSAAILKIAEMTYTGANSYFLAILLNKKYALPYRVIDALVDHFMRFLNDPRKMPVLWQQALLIFTQRYKTDLLAEQKENIKSLIKVQPHPFFSEEVRRELLNSKNRGDPETQDVEMKM